MKQIFQRKSIRLLCVIVLILFLAFMVYLIAYNVYYSTPRIYGLSEYTYDPLDGVKVYTDQEQYATEGKDILVTIHYESREEWDVLGFSYLELWRNGAWHSLRLLESMSGPLMEINLGPGSLHQGYLARSLYGPRLRPGHYRVVVTLGDEGGYAAAEFDIV